MAAGTGHRFSVQCLIAGLLLGLGALPCAAEESAPEPAGEPAWPFVRPLFALHAAPQSRVRLGAEFATGPLTSAVGFSLEGSWAPVESLAIRVRGPLGLSFAERGGVSFSGGDAELGLLWRLYHDPSTERQLSLGLDFSGPTSRIGEEKDLAGVQSGRRQDDSNFGRRYLLAQRPLIDMGLNPKTNLTVTPWVAIGQNLGRVSLQADFGCLVLVQDRVDEAIYGTRRRVGAVLFYDLAVPVSLTPELALLAELNGLVALDTLEAVGLALGLGVRYSLAGVELGLGAQLPLTVDGEAPDGDYALGRSLHAALVRQHFSVLLDLAYRF
ncbi:MAG TPA: hypothetical protein PK668_22070 [Myxococcota bacterium]|nr:hypothetical protein [Myxococcota bacterium]HRY96337.1 hypothetical protein [Myxococcota bacterium]HSA24256.1 hypothetical protein [Myxococcota bacterium]